MNEHVFLSYVWEDSERILRLHDALASRGIDVWLDRNKILPGQRWRAAIAKAIDSGAFFIACFSEASRWRDESYMNEEILLAIERLRKMPTDRTWFIPVKLSRCQIPARPIGAGETLRDIQYVDLADDWASGLDRIVNLIRHDTELKQSVYDLLHSNSPRARLIACMKLGQLRDARAVPSLIQIIMAREDPEVREGAIKALGQIGDPTAVRSIVPMLNDDEPGVCRAAAFALTELGGGSEGEALDALLDTLASGNAAGRCSAAEVLGKHGDERVVSRLAAALRDPEWQVSSAAARALVRVGSTPARAALDAHLPALVEALHSKRAEVRRSAIHTLGAVGSPQASDALLNALSHRSRHVRHAAAHALGKEGVSKALPALREVLEAKGGRRSDAVFGLLNIATANVSVKPEVIRLLIGALDDPDEIVRIDAAYALRSLGTPDAMRAVRKHERTRR